MMKRVVEYWHPEESTIGITGRRDTHLAAAALLYVSAAGDSETTGFIERSFSRDPLTGGVEAPECLLFTRDEASLVVSALIQFEKSELNGHPVKSHRVRGLVGSIVTEAPISFVPAEAYAKILEAGSRVKHTDRGTITS